MSRASPSGRPRRQLLNNQTLVVLGGLIENKRTLNRTGIPFLNRIPILGFLFGSVEEKIEKTAYAPHPTLSPRG
ncbi:MAG: hypothetical protein ACRELW_09355, partial [Candidatus Rokuibacteriota bacterium]